MLYILLNTRIEDRNLHNQRMAALLYQEHQINWIGAFHWVHSLSDVLNNRQFMLHHTNQCADLHAAHHCVAGRSIRSLFEAI